MEDKHQQKYNELVDYLEHTNYSTKYFCGGRMITQLICRSDKVVLQNYLQNYVVNGYKTYLLHPRIDLNETTIGRHYYWPNLRDDILTPIKICRTFQKNKKQSLKYGPLPDKEAETNPWRI